MCTLFKGNIHHKQDLGLKWSSCIPIYDTYFWKIIRKKSPPRPQFNIRLLYSIISFWVCDNLIFPWKFDPFMYCPFVSSQTSLCCCLMVALPARVFHSFMYCSLVPSKISLWSKLLAALSARVFDSFMYCLLVLRRIRFLWQFFMQKIIMDFQHIFGWFYMLTLLTRKHVQCLYDLNWWITDTMWKMETIKSIYSALRKLGVKPGGLPDSTFTLPAQTKMADHFSLI